MTVYLYQLVHMRCIHGPCAAGPDLQFYLGHELRAMASQTDVDRNLKSMRELLPESMSAF